MRLQVLSDLHLETEAFDPQPADGAEALVLAGDIDATWVGFERFAPWPVPVLVVPGNHEFDGRDVDRVVPALREHCARLGQTLLYRESTTLTDSAGRRVRFVATTRWSDFDSLGPAQRERAMRAAGYFLKLMAAQRDGAPFEAQQLRAEGLACRAWLERALSQTDGTSPDATVAITHFAPSLRSVDPRYGVIPSTASFCNADDDLIERADLWIHGHVHCRHDYTIARPGRRPSRVISQARGLASKGEVEGYEPGRLFVV